MTLLRRLGPVLLVLFAAPALADPIAALDEAESIQNTQRSEIARILEADNLDAGSMTARQLATAIAQIPRGAAPEDFWLAYQAHVRAWRNSAAAGEKLEGISESKFAERENARTQMIEAEMAIGATFAEVARIAESYGVAMPEPPGGIMDDGQALEEMGLDSI